MAHPPSPARPSTLTEVLLERYRAEDPEATVRMFLRLRSALLGEVRGHPYYPAGARRRQHPRLQKKLRPAAPGNVAA